MFFKLLDKDKYSSARLGRIETAHGVIETPVFMPVGTVGSVKTVHQRELKEDIHAKIILGNTYHLYLRPGLEILQGAGGLHKFIGWDLPMLTDSGGYQVFSLADQRKMSEEGALFQSHVDGSKHLFTPEYVIDIQRVIGADIFMAFDECTPYPCPPKDAQISMELTHRWLKRCVDQYRNSEQLYGYEQYLFPIVQGSVYPELRKISAEVISSFDLPGNAIGGLSVGEPAKDMYDMTELVCNILPQEKPRYLMGVGTPENLLECISRGVDMFDCVMPTRNGRNGMLFTTQGIINIKNAKWKNDYSPIDSGLDCYASLNYSKAYLRHLTISNEYLASQISSVHNLSFYVWLMNQAREELKKGSFNQWKNKMVEIVSRRITA